MVEVTDDQIIALIIGGIAALVRIISALLQRSNSGTGGKPIDWGKFLNAVFVLTVVAAACFVAYVGVKGPSARILSPDPGDTISRMEGEDTRWRVHVEGESQRLPRSRTLWLLLGSYDSNEVHPQVGVQLYRDGRWSATVNLWGKDNAGEWSLVVASVNREAEESFKLLIRKAQRGEGKWSVASYPAGAEPLTHITLKFE